MKSYSAEWLFRKLADCEEQLLTLIITIHPGNSETNHRSDSEIVLRIMKRYLRSITQEYFHNRFSDYEKLENVPEFTRMPTALNLENDDYQENIHPYRIENIEKVTSWIGRIFVFIGELQEILEQRKTSDGNKASDSERDTREIDFAKGSSPHLPNLQWIPSCTRITFKDQDYDLNLTQAQIMKEVVEGSLHGPVPICQQAVVDAINRGDSQIRMILRDSPIWQGLLVSGKSLIGKSLKGTICLNLDWDPPSEENLD